MVSRASCTVRIFSDWMSSCRVKNGWSVADSFELCWYTTDLHTQIQNHVDEHKNAPNFSQQLFRVCQSNTLFMSCLWLASTCSAWTGGQNRLSSVGFKSLFHRNGHLYDSTSRTLVLDLGCFHTLKFFSLLQNTSARSTCNPTGMWWLLKKTFKVENHFKSSSRHRKTFFLKTPAQIKSQVNGQEIKTKHVGKAALFV